MNVPIRIDRYLLEKYSALNRRQVLEAIEAGLVLSATGRKLKKGMRFEQGDEPNCKALDQHLLNIEQLQPKIELPIVFEVDDFVVVDKPAGIASQPISLFDSETVSHWALHRYGNLRKEFTEAQPTVTPHRLDRGTSGLLVVAKNRLGYEMWRERFTKKLVSKKYHTWCWGSPKKDHYEMDLEIAHALGDSRKMTVVREGGRYSPPILEAHSAIRVLKKTQDSEMFLAEVVCNTGVTHQVRVHLWALGFPLVGDALYDLQFELRSIKPNFHELRASELSCPGFIVDLEMTDFAKKYL